MSWKETILDKYWAHLLEKHQNDANFDIYLERDIAQDWLWNGCEVADRSVIVMKCDHINCKWERNYHVMYYVTPQEED